MNPIQRITVHFQPFHNLNDFPDEILLKIFALKEDILAMAFVSKHFLRLAHSSDVRKKILPPECFGEEAWKKHIGIPEKETPFPLGIYKAMDEGKGYLTWVPKSVTIIIPDGNQKVFINLLNLSMLFGKPKVGFKTGYAPRSWPAAINEKRAEAEAHWIWISKRLRVEVEEKKDTFFSDFKSLLPQKKKPSTDLTDILVTVFARKMAFNENCFNIGFVNGTYTWIRANETTNELAILIGYANDRFSIGYSNQGTGQIAVLRSKKIMRSSLTF